MSTGSSSTQLCSQQLDDILGPDLTQFEILICQMISEDEDQVSRSKALFHLALRSRPDSLLLALSELLAPGLPLVRAVAAKQIGEIFTTFSSNVRKTTLDTLKLDLLSAYRNEVSDSDVRKHLLRSISDFHATGSWPELLPNLFEYVNSQSPYFQEHELLVFKSLAENSNGNAALIPHLETFQKIFSGCLGNCSSWDVKIAALDASISFVQFIPNRQDPNRFDYLLRLMMLTLTEALNSGSDYKTEDSLHLLIKLAGTDPRFFERQLEKVLRLMLKITTDDSLEVNIKHLAIQFLMALVEKEPRMISNEPQFIKRLFDELMYMLFDFEEVDDAAIANAAVAAKEAARVTVFTVDVTARAVTAAAAAVATAADAAADEVASAAATAAADEAAAAAVRVAFGAAHTAAVANAAADAAAAVDAAAAATAAAAAATTAAAAAATAAATAATAAATAADAAAAAATAAATATAAAACYAACDANFASHLDTAFAAHYAAHNAAHNADAAALRVAQLASASASASASAACATAATTADSNGDEVHNFWKLNNYALGKECLSKLSISLGEKTIFQWVLRFFSHLLGTSIWQQRHAVLIAIPIIAKGCYKVMLENLDEIVPKVLKSLNDLHPCVRLAAIKAIRHLSVVFGPELQTRYDAIVLITLDKAMKDPLRPIQQAAAASAALTFLTNGTENIIDLYKWKIIDEFRKFLKDNDIFIKKIFLRSELVKIVSMLKSDIDGWRAFKVLRLYLERSNIDGRWSGELHREYLSRITWLLSLGINLRKSNLDFLFRLRTVIQSYVNF